MRRRARTRPRDGLAHRQRRFARPDDPFCAADVHHDGRCGFSAGSFGRVVRQTLIRAMKLIYHNYGKAKVRVLKVMRAGKIHSIKELDVQVMLQGDFDASYTKADNRLVVATDSIKNTVNIFA